MRFCLRNGVSIILKKKNLIHRLNDLIKLIEIITFSNYYIFASFLKP